MKRRLLSVMLCIMLVLSCAPAALAASDTTPPELRSFEFSKSSYISGEDVVVVVSAFDESGLESTWSRVTVKNVDGTDTRQIDLGFGTDITTAEDEGKCIYTMQYNWSVNDNFPTGTYYISEISLMDLSNNRCSYSVDLNIPKYKLDMITANVVNNVRSDFTGPQVSSISIDKTSIAVGESVNFTISAADESGLSSAAVVLSDPEGRQIGYSVGLWPAEEHPGTLTGSFQANSNSQPGKYTVSYFVVWDKYNNETGFSDFTGGTYTQIPNEWRRSFTVTNSNYSAKNPTVDNISLSKKSAKPGDTVHIEADIKNNGSSLLDYVQLYLCPVERPYGFGDVVYLLKNASGKYECDWTVPANFQQCSYEFRLVIIKESGADVQYYNECNGYVFPKFTVTSVFSGLDDRIVMVGDTFDPLDGVSASNETEGDLRDKITLYGSVNTSQAGIYLLRYRIKSNQKSSSLTDLYYYESRWVGVTEIMPPSSDPNAPMVLTNDALRLGAQASDVTVKRDGSKVSYASTYTTPGVYSISEKAVTASSAASALSAPGTLSTGASADSTANAVIDRKGPAVTAAWGKSGSSIKVSVKAADVAGVAQLKYKSGACKLADFKTGGKAFTGTFTVSKKGTYTVYAKDKLGNESVKQIKVTSSSAGFAYLSSIGVTGGKLSPGFSKKEYSYKISVGENQPDVTLKPAKEWEGASVTINGKAVSSAKISVGNGKTVKATVKVTYGDASKTYTFSITRAKSTNNKLSDIKATAGKFNKAFSADTTKYTLALDEKTSSTTIKAVTQNSKAESSPESVKVKLSKGESKTVKFTVTAQSGAKKTYSVTVKRAKSTSTKLEYIKTNSSKCPLSPAFSTGTSSYTVTLPADRSKVTLSAKAVSSYASVKVDGTKGAKTFTLSSGQSITVKVVVTAQSGKKKEYSVTIKRL